MTVYTLILLQTPAASNPIIGFLPLILIIGIFYLLVFMPMQRQKKQTAAMLKNLQNGQTVVTSGGIVGTIVYDR
jgi:preprotein translocase subunit YajC